MKTGTEESGDDAFLPGFYPSVEPPKEAGLLSDQALREEAGTLAALSNAKQQLAINHQFRAFDFKQDTCQFGCVRMGVGSGIDYRRRFMGAHDRTVEKAHQVVAYRATSVCIIGGRQPRCARFDPATLTKDAADLHFASPFSGMAGTVGWQHARAYALIASRHSTRLRTPPTLA